MKTYKAYVAKPIPFLGIFNRAGRLKRYFLLEKCAHLVFDDRAIDGREPPSFYSLDCEWQA